MPEISLSGNLNQLVNQQLEEIIEKRVASREAGNGLACAITTHLAMLSTIVTCPDTYEDGSIPVINTGDFRIRRNGIEIFIETLRRNPRVELNMYLNASDKLDQILLTQHNAFQTRGTMREVILI